MKQTKGAKKLLRKLREQVGLSRAEASRRAGMNASTWGLVETGRFIPYPGQLTRMQEVVGHTGDPAELLEEVEPS